MAAAKSRTSDPCTVDTQGRTIIPKQVREALGIQGDKAHVVYEMDGQGVRVRKVKWSPE